MSKLTRIAVLLLFVCALASVASAAPFEKLFLITKIEGTCSVKPAGATEFTPAAEGKAYAYGTAIKTERKSSAVIKFSEGNECRILAKATLELSEDTTDQKLKIIKLDEGKLEISLEENIHEVTGDGLNVETATAICGAIGCDYDIEARKEQDINVAVFVVKKGAVWLKGMNFNIARLETGAGVSVSGDDGNTFTRVRTLKGAFEIQYKDSEGNPKVVTTEQNSIIKIWRRKSEVADVVIITILFIGPDGTSQPADVFTEQSDEKRPVGNFNPNTPVKISKIIIVTSNGEITIKPLELVIQPRGDDGESVTPVGKGRS